MPSGCGFAASLASAANPRADGARGTARADVDGSRGATFRKPSSARGRDAPDAREVDDATRARATVADVRSITRRRDMARRGDARRCDERGASRAETRRAETRRDAFVVVESRDVTLKHE